MLMDSGDVLATISKVKRRMRHNENDGNRNNTDRAGGIKNILL